MLNNAKRVAKDIKCITKAWPDEILWLNLDDHSGKLTACVKGPHGTDFEGGEYVFSFDLTDFPHKAPVIKALTPSGRYETNTAICIDGLSHYHSESWTPAIKLGSIINAIQSTMTDTMHGVGSISVGHDRKKLASESRKYNRMNVEPRYTTNILRNPNAQHDKRPGEDDPRPAKKSKKE